MVTKNSKKILITAGPTWVAIDKARVIGNIASGETGFILAEKFKKLGAKVTLLLGPGYFCGTQTGIKIIRFKYFSQLAQLLENELKKGRYSAVIHAAAVADYAPKKIIRHKVSSRRSNWKINLVPTKKLINDLKNYGAGLFIVGFKFEPDEDDAGLIEKGRRLLKQADLDMVVANSNKNTAYRAFILDNKNKYGPFPSKIKMAGCLSGLVEKKIWQNSLY
ncbi:MAG: phosphopantothenoylcysteine decarboxylase [Candidatus Omnitrophica bacterium]|nr:phosphopantothenoylcysteine decarboxylase [Candidatus Omnitrophota bacterium]